jgi:outer membrane murein-binding lipoprotein Lpp
MRNSTAARAPRDDDDDDDRAYDRQTGRDQTRRPADERPRLRLAPPMPVSGPRVAFVVMIVVLVMAGVVGILALNQKINENAFKLDNLRAEQAKLDRQEQDLNQQIAEKEAPGNLAAQARKLGLVPAGAPAFIRLPDGRVVGVPQPANGKPAITSQGG